MEFLPLSRTLHTPSSSDRKTIYLTIFGEVDNTVFDINNLIDYTQRFFQMEVKLINPFINVQWNDEKNQWTCKFSWFKMFFLVHRQLSPRQLSPHCIRHLSLDLAYSLYVFVLSSPGLCNHSLSFVFMYSFVAPAYK